jgi:hypothetical protein
MWYLSFCSGIVTAAAIRNFVNAFEAVETKYNLLPSHL